MTEKISCPACAKKYSLEKHSVCPSCRLSEKDAKFYGGGKTNLEALGLNGEFEMIPYTGLDAQDLRDDVNRLGGAVSALATGLLLMIVFTIAGALFVTGGTAETLSCALQRENCEGSESILWGQICLGLGILSRIVSSITAISRSSLD
jgi:hypothetical protein